MIVVVHETTRMAKPVESGYDRGEDREETLFIPVVQEDGPSLCCERLHGNLLRGTLSYEVLPYHM